jgi:hypothetical protein
MKLKITFVTILLSIFIVYVCLSLSISKKSSLVNAQSKYILVRDAEMMRSGIKKINAAILITDVEKIKSDELLFLGNKAISHACGYHYNIQYWDSNDQLLEEFPFNKECEKFINNNSEIQSLMNEYIRILENKPSHYIYNLKIRTTTDPEIVKKSFENSNLNIFFLKGKMEHLPHLVFTYMQVSELKEMEDKTKWEEEQNVNRKIAINKMNSIVEEVEKVATVKEKSKVSFPMEGFGKTIEHKAEMTMRFSKSDDLFKAKEIITKNGGEIDQERNPEYYYIQLVDAAENISDVKKKINKFKFVLDVFEYPSTSNKK